jgi:FAD/FMN-containing dehydrogenase
VTGARVFLYGHAGDGSLHVNVSMDRPSAVSVEQLVFPIVAELGGSVSAEHGVGADKAGWIGLTRAPAELDAMRAIKDALDPLGLFNPGVVLPAQREARPANP